jgi:hypothetical protein
LVGGGSGTGIQRSPVRHQLADGAFSQAHLPGAPGPPSGRRFLGPLELFWSSLGAKNSRLSVRRGLHLAGPPAGASGRGTLSPLRQQRRMLIFYPNPGQPFSGAVRQAAGKRWRPPIGVCSANRTTSPAASSLLGVIATSGGLSFLAWPTFVLNMSARSKKSVSVIEAAGKESAPTSPIPGATAPEPPECDPYFSNNVIQVAKGRAWADVFLQTYALGSNEPMGLYNAETFRNLIKDGPS